MKDHLTEVAPPTVFVYGPRGCGKTHNAEALRSYFGCSHVVDPYEGIATVGALHLCVVNPGITPHGNTIVYPFVTAMSFLKGDTVAARVEKDPDALAVQEGGSHYKDMPIQPAEYIHANALGYFEGNVVKYVSRWRKKNGVEDLKKARHYIDLLIELEGKKV